MKEHTKDIIISLFDFSGNWSRPYREHGFTIVQIDIKLGQDILTWGYTSIPQNRVMGVLAAVPCTDYSLSGAQYFRRKDLDGTTDKSNALVNKTFEIIDYFRPTFWALENPMSRIHKLHPRLGQPRQKFHPCDFAQYDPNPIDSQYSKMTWLWGDFNPMEKRWLPPIQGQAPIMKLGGKSERTKEMRSKTPLGFAYAFYEANH